MNHSTPSRQHGHARRLPRLHLIWVWLFLGGVALAQSSRSSEQAGLDGLLSIIEAQTRYAYRNGHYAASIAELGFQASVMSAGQLASQGVFAADYGRPGKTPFNGYYFRILPVRGEASANEPNSFWAVALPAENRDDLPVFVTAAYRIAKLEDPLAGWWALRLHGKSRETVARLFADNAPVGIGDLALNPAAPETYASGTVVRRFLLDRQHTYPPVEGTKMVKTGSPPLLFAAIIVVACIFIFSAWRKNR